MTGRMPGKLLGPDDPAPFAVYNATGRSPFLLIGDHAGGAIPAALGDLGLTAADRGRHIAIDIGVLGLGIAMARRLDAPFIHQIYSRLVIDCNRDPLRADAIPVSSDHSAVAGNMGLRAEDRDARIAAIHRPYHAAIAAMIDARLAAGQDVLLIALHSFTPVMDGFARPWHVGVLHGTGPVDFALALLHALRKPDHTVGDNDPYRMDETDYSIGVHALPRALGYAEIEVRQDLIADAAGQSGWAEHLARSAEVALSRIA